MLVGWSMGAMVALEYLRAFGQDAVAGLVIVDQPPSDFAWDGYEFSMFTAEVLAHTVAAIQMDQTAVATEFAELMLHAPTPDVVAKFVAELIKPPPAVAASILVDQTFRDYREFLPEVAVPTLVAFGGDDKATNPAAGKWMADRIPGARWRSSTPRATARSSRSRKPSTGAGGVPGRGLTAGGVEWELF